MTFQLETITKAKLLDVVVLSQKNRQPDENPGAKLTVEIALPNHALAYFDGHLKAFLFTKNGGQSPKAKQETLEGVEVVSDMPNLSAAGAKIGALKWHHELTGFDLVVDLGTGTKRSNLEIADCVLSGWKITPKEGGSVLVKVNIESANISEAGFGKLAKLKSREINILLTPPEIDQRDLEDEAPAPAPAAVKRGRQSATDAFIERNTH